MQPDRTHCFTGKMRWLPAYVTGQKILDAPALPKKPSQSVSLMTNTRLDGRSAKRRYTGIAWSIGGVHDRAWFDRPVYGKVRYMNANGCTSEI